MPNSSIQILFVDDDLEFLEVLRDYFGAEGHAVVTASSGHEALEILNNSTFDLIVSDVDMPKMSGIQFLQELQNRNIPIPFVFLSAHTTMSERKALDLGAVGYFEKPQRLDDMRQGLLRISENLQT